MYKIYLDGALFCDSEIDELAIKSPVIETEINRAGSFSFTIPADHPYLSLVEPLRSVISVHRFIGDSEDIFFLATCASVKETIYGEKQVLFEGALALNNRMINTDVKLEITNRTIESVFKAYSFPSFIPRPGIAVYMTPGVCQITDKKGLNSIDFGDINTNAYALNRLTELFGGYIYLHDIRLTSSSGGSTKRYDCTVDYLAELPSECNQRLVLGENLISLDVTYDEPEIFTDLIVCGSITGSSRYRTTISIPDLKTQYGKIEKAIIFDGQTSIYTLEKLGREYIKNNLFKTTTVTAQILDLSYINPAYDSIKPGHMVHVYSKAHNIDRDMKVISRSYNLNDPKNDTVKLGATENYEISTT